MAGHQRKPLTLAQTISPLEKESLIFVEKEFCEKNLCFY